MSRALAVIVIGTVLASTWLVRDAGTRTTTAPEYRRPVSHLAPQRPATTLPGRVRVTVLRDPGARQWYGARADTILDRWVAALRSVGAAADIRDAGHLARADSADVLVVASTPCLGADARRAIDSARARRQGLLLAGEVGTMDGACWRQTGFGLVAWLAGARRVETLARPEALFVTLPDGGALAHGLPPGARMQLYGTDYVAIRHDARDGYYSDLYRNPRPVRQVPLLDGALAHWESRGLRVTWWGFDIANVAGDAWNEHVGKTLLRNSVAWAAGVPVATAAPWPGGAAAAAVLAQDVETDFADARHALDSLELIGAPATFFVLSSFAGRERDLARRLAAYGELGSHGDDHSRFGGQPPEWQRERIQRTRHTLAATAGVAVAGLRPPEEEYDDATLAAWSAAGGSYVFSATDGASAGPELFDIDGRLLVLLGRLTEDDFHSVVLRDERDAGRLGRDYVLGYQRVRALGGLYVLSYHSQLLSQPALVGAVARLARQIKSDSAAWFTTAGAVADWWAARHRLELTPSVARGRVLVSAVNRAGVPLAGAVVRVTLPPGARTVAVRGGTLLTSPPGEAHILLPTLDPGASHQVSVITHGTRRHAD